MPIGLTAWRKKWYTERSCTTWRAPARNRTATHTVIPDQGVAVFCWHMAALTNERSYNEMMLERVRRAAEQSADRLRAEAALRQPPVWEPQPGPQSLAYHSAADVIGYGGAAGGGKTDLLLGMAATRHQRSIILRRVFPSVRALIERSREIFVRTGEDRAHDSFNESLHIWRLADDRSIEFGAVQFEKDKLKHQGQPRDFMGFDEATEFSESIVRFLMAWNRTTAPGQRCQVMLTFNPPLDEAQDWVVRFFAPWLDPAHPQPAQDGELRYYAMIDGSETELLSGEPFEYGGETITPRSRTFFHASLKDNPILESTGYGSQIDALPEPLRSLLKGRFDTARIENPFQVIPTDWVKAAMKRWTERPRPDDLLMTSIGADVAYGGRDQFVIAPLYGGYWADSLIKLPGYKVPDGLTGASHVLAVHRHNAEVRIDFIGWGTAAYEHLRELVPTLPVNFGEATTYTDRTGRMRFANVRAAAYWNLREALNPDNHSQVCLPDDRELLIDLTAPKWELRTGKIYLEPKDDIKERIGRSPDCGDAVVLAFWGAEPVAREVMAGIDARDNTRWGRDSAEGGRWGRSEHRSWRG